MIGLPIDVKRAPMSRREHRFLRLGCLAAVGGLLAVSLLFEYLWELGGPAAVLLSVALYLLWGAGGLDLGVLFESHESYLARYRVRQERALEEGAALFREADSQRRDEAHREIK